MPGKIRKQIILEFQQDESFSESISTELDRTTLAVQDPAAYLSMGLNLKRNQQVPLTSLDLMIRLSRQSAEKYLKQISPYEEETQLILLSGNEVAMNLIREMPIRKPLLTCRDWIRKQPKTNIILVWPMKRPGTQVKHGFTTKPHSSSPLKQSDFGSPVPPQIKNKRREVIE